LIIVSLLCLSVLCSCRSAKLTPSGLAKTEVGRVGSHAVYYEELYFLANAYKRDGMTAEELWDTINENIVINHAILTLCEQSGVEYDEKQLKKDIQAYIDNIVTTDCDGVGDYRDKLKETHMTDSYMRFNAKVDLMYNKVPTALALKGALLSDKEAICNYIETNFIRTWHYMLAKNEGDNIGTLHTNMTIAEEALKSEKATIWELTKGSYAPLKTAPNEDILMPSDGYTFAKGSMQSAYEAAAFSLKVGEFSSIIMAKGETASGEYTDCFYIIERLKLDREYILANYEKLYDGYVDAVVAQKLSEVKSSLTFEANDFAKSLNILELKSIGIGTNVPLIIVISCIFVAIAGTVIAIVLRVRYVRKRRRALIQAKNEARLQYYSKGKKK
jgi:hypothetical protein